MSLTVMEIIKEYRKGCSCGDSCSECADAAINAIEKRMNQHISTRGVWSCTESELMEIVDAAIASYREFTHESRKYLGTDKLEPISLKSELPIKAEKVE